MPSYEYTAILARKSKTKRKAFEPRKNTAWQFRCGTAITRVASARMLFANGAPEQARLDTAIEALEQARLATTNKETSKLFAAARRQLNLAFGLVEPTLAELDQGNSG